MNSYEKEVIKAQLEAERQILFRLKAIYEQAAKDVSEKLEISNGKIEILLEDIDNADEQTRSILKSQIYQRDFQHGLKERIDEILEGLNRKQYDTISEYLIDTYSNSFVGTLYTLNQSGLSVIIPPDVNMVLKAVSIDSKISKPLYKKLGEDVQLLKKRIANNISRGISTASPYRDIARNISNCSKMGVNRAMCTVRTESGRIYNAASLDSGKAAKTKTGADLVKVWDSTLDSLTRPHHRQLDNQVRELDEDFEVDGLTASAPGHFGIAKEDINCRCVVLIKPRWDLEGPFTKRNNETGELLEFQDVQNYETFKEKYWEKVDNSGESGIIGITRNANGQEVVIVKHTNIVGNPNSITQKESSKGGIERNYYGENGKQNKQIANNNHGKPKQHPYGKNGEHAHDYIYDEFGHLIDRPIRELTDFERKENGDIL